MKIDWSKKSEISNSEKRDIFVAGFFIGIYIGMIVISLLDSNIK